MNSKKGSEIGNIDLKKKFALDFTEERVDDYAELKKARAEKQKAQEEELMKARLESEQAEEAAKKEEEAAAAETATAEVKTADAPAEKPAEAPAEEAVFTLPVFSAEKKAEPKKEEPKKEDLFDDDGDAEPIALGSAVTDEDGNPIFYAPAGQKFEKLGTKQEVADRLAAAAEDAPKTTVTVLDGGKKDDEPKAEEAVKDTPKEAPKEALKQEPAGEAPKKSDAAGVDELLSEKHRKIKAARFDRVFVDGKKADGKKLFDTEEELEDFIKSLDGKGAIRKGYYKGYRVTGVLPPVAVSGATADFVRCQGDQMDEEDLIGYGVLSKDALSFLKAAVAGGCSLLVAGEKKTGKTSILDRLASLAGDADDLYYVIENGASELNVDGRDTLKELACPEEGVTEDYLLNEAAEEAGVIALGALTEASADGYLKALRNGVQCLATIETEKDIVNIAKAVAANARENAAEVGKALAAFGDIVVSMYDDTDGIKKVEKIGWLRKDRKSDDGDLFVESLFARSDDGLMPSGSYPTGLAEKCSKKKIDLEKKWFGTGR